jgi:hypothetical protein
MNYVQPGYVRTGYIQQDSDTIGPFRFDGHGKFIFVSEALPRLDLAQMYSRWKEWVRVEHGGGDTNAKWLPAIRYSGYDPIPNGFTGATFFMVNGWRVIYNPNTTAVDGVLYSETFDTAYWNYDKQPVFPVTVSAVVNQVTTTQNIVSGDVASIVASMLAALQATTIPVDTKKMNGADVIGTGAEGDPWRGVGVQP